jgi:hypothetical protein
MVKKDIKERKTKKIEVLCTEDQLRQITKRARQYLMSNSEFGLFTMLNSQISVTIGADPVIAQLTSLVEMYEKNHISKDEFDNLRVHLFKESGLGRTTLQ